MNLKKNLGIKVVAACASIAALLAAWGIVHTNPPPGAAADTSVPTTTSGQRNPAAPTRSTPVKRPHTRTHGS